MKTAVSDVPIVSGNRKTDDLRDVTPTHYGPREAHTVTRRNEIVASTVTVAPRAVPVCGGALSLLLCAAA